MDLAWMPSVGKVYDLAFRRAGLGSVRALVLASDQPTSTPCGARTVPIKLISGSIPKANPDRMVGPGEVTALPVFVAKWTLVQEAANG